MSANESEWHVAELKRTLHELCDEAEKRVATLEEELARAREVVVRMRAAIESAERPYVP